MKKISFLLLVAFISCGFSHGYGGQGRITSSIGTGDLPNAFLNYAKNWQSLILNGQSPTVLNDNGYPISSLSATVSGEMVGMPRNYIGNWIVKWSGQGGIQLGEAGTVVLDPGACQTGGVLTFKGTNCRVVYTRSSPTTNQVAIAFPISTTYSSMSGLVICREADEAAITAGQYWTPEFIQTIKLLNPFSLRLMGLVQSGAANLSNQPGWAYRTPLAYFSYTITRFPSSLWAGTASGTDQYTVGPAPDTPVTWTDGEAIQMLIPNAGRTALGISGWANNGSGLFRATISDTTGLTTGQTVYINGVGGQVAGAPLSYGNSWVITVIDATHFDLQGSTFASGASGGVLHTTTVNVNSRGAKFAVENFVLTGANIQTNSIVTMRYDAILDVLLTTRSNGANDFSGLTFMVPIEAMVNLANTLNIPLWLNIPPFYTPPSVTSLITYVRDNLAPDLYLEFSNETWNFAFPQGQWMTQRGFSIGLSLSSNVAQYSAAALLYRQSMAAATTAWSPRSASQLHRIMAFQLFGNATQFETSWMKGTSLVSSGNALYTSKVGVDYNVAPNRPMDFSDGISIADYFQGGQISGVTTNDVYGCSGRVLADIAPLISWASQYALGDNTNKQLAIAQIDTDVRSGSFAGCGASNPGTIASLATLYAPWNTMAASNSIGIYNYEGGFAGAPPTVGWLTTKGDATPTTTNANIIALINGWRLSFLSYNTTIFWGSQFMALSQARAGSWLTIGGPPASSSFSQFVLLQGGFDPSLPWQVYDGMAAFNHGQN